MMPACDVKPSVKRNKNGAAEAEAICEAVTRPTMRFGAIKAPEQRAVLMRRRTRQLLVRLRIMRVNALRAHLAEFGILAGLGRTGVEKLLEVVAKGQDERVPPAAGYCLLALRDQLVGVKQRIPEADRRILAWHRSSEAGRRLAEIPGVGPLIATARGAAISDPVAFRSGRDLSAWIGLLPKQNSTGGKERFGGISKAGNRYLRTLLVTGALSVIRRAKQADCRRRPWLATLVARRSTKVAAIALANKTARDRLGKDGPWHLLSRASTTGHLRQARAPARAHQAGKGR